MMIRILESCLCCVCLGLGLVGPNPLRWVFALVFYLNPLGAIFVGLCFGFRACLVTTFMGISLRFQTLLVLTHHGPFWWVFAFIFEPSWPYPSGLVLVVICLGFQACLVLSCQTRFLGCLIRFSSLIGLGPSGHVLVDIYLEFWPQLLLAHFNGFLPWFSGLVGLGPSRLASVGMCLGF